MFILRLLDAPLEWKWHVDDRFDLFPMGCRLLTEQEVSRSWQKLFTGGEVSKETFTKAETLLDELRTESPLYHRLTAELAEIRKMRSDEDKKTRKRTKAKVKVEA